MSDGNSLSREVSSSNEKPVPPTPMKEVKRQPVPKSAVERVVSRKIKGEFGATGRGEDADWGISKSANFKYTVIVSANSKIVSKEILDSGAIKVTEIRKFDAVQDSLVVSDVDIKFSLETLATNEFSFLINGLCSLWGYMTGDYVTPIGVKTWGKRILKTIDGVSLRQLIGTSGVKPSAEVKDWMNNLANAKIKKALGEIRSVSGKSYKIVYYQKKNGEPMLVNFFYENGDPIVNYEEKLVLQRVNAFIDDSLVRDKECVPGDSWNIRAEGVQELFDPYVDGKYIGNIRATRKENLDNGDWRIDFSPSNINIISSSGNTNGHLKIARGYAHVNPESMTTNEIFAEGEVEALKLTKHHILFQAKIHGACSFQGRIVTVVSE